MRSYIVVNEQKKKNTRMLEAVYDVSVVQGQRLTEVELWLLKA